MLTNIYPQSGPDALKKMILCAVPNKPYFCVLFQVLTELFSKLKIRKLKK